MILNSIQRRFFLAAFLGAGLLAASLGQAATIVTGYLSGTNNWYRTNFYQLNGMVFVRSNGVLNIEAGTVIKGHNLGPDSTNIAALVICRGAKIFAEGTAKHPIIFTAEADDPFLPDDMPIWGATARGLWGGVVILGRCEINGAIDASGNAATPKYEVYEGLPDVIASGGEALLRFGGTDDNDNSGILRYVSIRHGGAALFANKEINGLSMGAVGRGTTIEFVESYCAADDGFEFFGGTVNTRYLVSSFNDDDSFDTDMGYRGTNQFWFAIQAPDKRNYGMELNNHPNELPQTSQNTPAADFKVYNMTIIGSGAANTVSVGGNNAAIALRPWVGPKIYNSIFTDFNERGVLLDTANGVIATQAVSGGFAQLHNTLWWDFVVGSATANINNTATNLGRNTVATNYWTDTTLTNQIANPLLGSISRTNVGTRLDPRPKAGSPALSDYATTPGNPFLTPVTYRGAFGPDDLWINGWTALSEYGILSPVGQRTNIVTGYLSGTNNWYRTNIYQLNGMVFVRSNGVLNIEAGTVIKGHNLGPDSTNISALVICRGAKIFAQGTPQNPIIFTAEVDDMTFFDDLPIWGATARGLWGGVVLLGRTEINGAIDASGNAATPKYEVYEGLPDVIASGGEALLRFGGTDDNDNSGILRYVSIRHGGAALFANKEINGLSMGAVGRGTTIEFVESYCAADDGFEFFGGTVNTRYLVSSFNDDDSFDTDMGYRGTNQFWFAIQAPDKRNYGMELNNHPNELPQTSQNTPAADFKVYNMTIIGSGAANTVSVGGNNAAIALRPWVGPKIYNSIFTDFNERGVLLDTANGVVATQAVSGGFAQLHNTLWWDFVVGSATANINNTATNLGRNTIATNYWTDTSLTNLISNPQITFITRTNVGPYLDPRPKAGSPALDAANIAATPGSLTAASQIGAFGSVNWASDWTALGEYGILTGAGGGNPRAVTVAAPTPNQPTLAVAAGTGLITISFISENGFQYQLQSSTDVSTLPGSWTNDGAPQAGTGGVLTFTPTTGPGAKFFRVIVP